MPRRKQRLTAGGGPYEVHVMRSDLDGAEPRNPGRCAIARALKRTYPEVGYIKVGNDTIKFSFLDPDGQRLTVLARTSIRAQEAQKKLDSGQPVGPDDFPPIRLFMDEVKIAPSGFNDVTRVQQNQYRAEVRDGLRTPVTMSEREKAKRRLGRRHA